MERKLKLLSLTERKLNLVGIKTLRLVEATKKVKVNKEWVASQLKQGGFTSTIKGDLLSIFYPQPVLQLVLTYDTKKGTKLISITLKNTDKFPNVPMDTKLLKGNELATEVLRTTILSMIPSSENIKIVESNGNGDLNNIAQNNSVKKILQEMHLEGVNVNNSQDDIQNDNTKVETLSISFAENTPIYTINASKKTLSVYDGMNKPKFTDYGNIENAMKIVEKNLGIGDLHSQLIIQEEEEQQDFNAVTDELTDEERKEEEERQKNQDNNPQEEQEKEEEQEPLKREFNRDTRLDGEAEELRKQLSSEVRGILDSIKEDFDYKNLGYWDTAYKNCHNDNERSTLIQYFCNKKMNMPRALIQDNMLSLKKWVDARGFNPKQNLALQFLDNWMKKYPGKNIPIPGGAIFVLMGLTNNNIISPNDLEILNDLNGVLYYANTYKNVEDNYNDIINIMKMYKDIYKMGRIDDNDKLVVQDYNFLNELNSPQQLAKEVVYDEEGKKLRNIDVIKNIYQQLTNDSFDDNYSDDSATYDVDDLKRMINNKKVTNVKNLSRKSADALEKGVNKIIQDKRIRNELLKGVSDTEEENTVQQGEGK